MEKNKILFFVIAMIITSLFAGCSKENLVGVNNSKTNTGGISLKINKEDVPSDVQQITAKLSRTNYDSLSATINVINDSLNVLSFENVPLGEWHLNVAATSSEGKIIYSGETDVTIIEDETVDVYLTLNPVGSGTGSIKIFVNWENKWIDYYNNPIFSNSLIPYGAAQCKIIFDNNIYKMWYTGLYSSAQAEIWYTESSDGIHWGSDINCSVLQKGETGAWDDYRVGTGAILKDGDVYKMYYNGWHDQYSVWQIGLAVSDDGISWQKYSNPILASSGNEYQIGVSEVIKKDNTYYMYYTYRSDAYTDNYKISLATSTDGVTWSRCNQNPIISPSQPWEGSSVSYPTVITENNQFIMIYQNQNRTSFGMAISEDGINWTKSTRNPIFNSNDVNNNWTNTINYPLFRKFNNEYRLYYTSRNAYDVLQIGFAKKKSLDY
jgi:predicted GH43/DUF377 family glycosyl hydrolase